MKKKNNKVLPIIICLAIVAVVIIVLLLIFLPGMQNDTTDNLKLDANQGEFVKVDEDQAAANASLPGIVLPGWGKITIPANTTDISSGIDFFNPEDNEGYYYMTFELLVDTDGDGEYESLYQSDLVEPGNHLQHITLSEPLEAGTYKAKVFIQPYLISDMETPLNSGSVDTELVVE